MVDNLQNNRGPGNWLFVTYNPLRAIGPIKGFLTVAKDFYTVVRPERNSKGESVTHTVANFPSQNIAYVINEWYFKESEPERGRNSAEDIPETEQE